MTPTITHARRCVPHKRLASPGNGPLYIAGPMTGIPSFNIPAFDRAAIELRLRGFTVVSPAELDDPDTRFAAIASPDGAPGTGTANGETWGDFLSRDVKVIADEVGQVAVLPGWEYSRGARLEVFVARLCGKPVYPYLEPVGGELGGDLARPLMDSAINRAMEFGSHN